MPFTILSNSFKDGDYLRTDHVLSADFGFGCGGGNRSPHLKWSGAPDGTKSYAVTCYDPDAPTGSGFWHWVVVNIPASVTELALGAGDPKGAHLPKGALMTRTDFGAAGYGGPCPPEGDHPHRYFFTVHAVGTELGVNADTSAAVIGFQLHFNTLAKAAIMGLYKR
jgi:Raf kinase inhibitor-like YbhB/YbcL family protein